MPLVVISVGSTLERKGWLRTCVPEFKIEEDLSRHILGSNQQKCEESWTSTRNEKFYPSLRSCASR